MKPNPLINLVVCSAVMLSAAMPLMAEWETADGIKWNYTVKDGKATVCRRDAVGWNGAIPDNTEGHVTIPSSLGGCPVTAVGAQALAHYDSLYSITIPSSVTALGQGAFEDCNALQAFFISGDNPSYKVVSGMLLTKSGETLVAVPGGVITVSIPSGVKAIGNAAFSGCANMTMAGFPLGVTSIGDYAFYDCSSLVLAYIPQGVRSIGFLAFSDCVVLRKVLIPSSVTLIMDYAFKNCPSITEVTIPQVVCNHKLSDYFPSYESITNVSIASGVTRIGDELFSKCGSLMRVGMPDSVEEIGDNAFNQCYKLADAKIPDGVRSIGSQAFFGCYPLDTPIPSSVTNIGYMAFESCESLSSVTIPSGMKNIASRTFCQCGGLTSVTIADSVTNIDFKAFWDCEELQSLTIGKGVKSIGDEAFSLCNALVSITLPKGVVSVGKKAFSYCHGLESVTVSDSVTSIGDAAFSNCTSLKTVSLPQSLKDNLPSSAFDGCPSDLQVVYRPSDPTYTVRYRKYDGSGETAEEQFECGKTYTLAWLGSQLGWTRSGYEFCGWVPWNPDTKPRLCKYDNGQPVKNLAAAGGTIELYCGWKSSSSYRVCFHRSAGPDDMIKMNQVILRNKEDSLAWMDSMIGWKRDGYTFAGWDESEKATTVKYANGAKVKNLAMNGGTKHLYAVWRARDDHKYPYAVKFYKYDGSGETCTQSFKAGTAQNLLWLESGLGWKRPGYEFVGWVPWNPDAKARLCKYTNGQKVVDLASKSGETINLYAGWKSSSSYRVCFHMNDGTDVKMNQVILRNKEDSLAWMDSQIGWKRDGYVFKGWAEKEGTSTVKYANGAKVKNLAMDGGTKHLYAVWKLAD